MQAESEKLASEALRDGTKVSERLRQGGVKLRCIAMRVAVVNPRCLTHRLYSHTLVPQVHFPSAVYDDLGDVTCCAASKDGASRSPTRHSCSIYPRAPTNGFSY